MNRPSPLKMFPAVLPPIERGKGANRLHLIAALLLSLLIGTAASAAQPGSPAPAAETTEGAMHDPGTNPEMERPTIWGEPTRVRILIYMIDVDEVNSAQQNFAASVFYAARWKSPFLSHDGPGPRYYSTTQVWTPRLIIVNEQQAWSAFPEHVEVEPDGEVTYRQKTWGHFSQPMDLRDFPLDRQTLTIHIAAVGLMEDEVTMIPMQGQHGRGSGIAQQFSVPDFDVASWTAGPAPYITSEGEIGTAGFQMEIKVDRHIPYFVMKIIIPLCLIVIMSWVPLWIDPKQIGPSIGVSTTAFLTLVAYLFAVTVLLPPVSYITRLDRFIFLATLMVFAGLVQTVTNTALIHAKRAALVERIEGWSRIIYPVTLLAILGVSFGL